MDLGSVTPLARRVMIFRKNDNSTNAKVADVGVGGLQGD